MIRVLAYDDSFDLAEGSVREGREDFFPWRKDYGFAVGFGDEVFQFCEIRFFEFIRKDFSPRFF